MALISSAQKGDFQKVNKDNGRLQEEEILLLNELSGLK
jgi:hypothetical protein